MIHHFQEDILFDGPQGFTDPFRYMPHPLVKVAAEKTIKKIDEDPMLADAFAEGKMLGVLVCKVSDCSKRAEHLPSSLLCDLLQSETADIVYIAGFSGNVGGRSIIEGFVPPIYDLLNPEGYFKEEEARISEINRKINEISHSDEFTNLRDQLSEYEAARDKELAEWTLKMQQSKQERAERRATAKDASELAVITKESQFEKAEFRRIKAGWAERISEIRNQLDKIRNEITELKKLRSEMSDKLQNWIFRQYIVHNAAGEEISIADLFASKGLTPQGGTGECAAPKLLEYAYRHSLEPIVMGEFWYGKSPETAVRTHGHFYPSCTSKCGPLLGFMLKGLNIQQETSPEDLSPEIIYEDEHLIVVEKPSGMPSVPGLDGRKSLQEWLSTGYGEIHAVHRLDMDTSGIMLFAKTQEAAVELRRQFEEHTIRKTYIARLSACQSTLSERDKGIIGLPLSADYDERPRQKADIKQGKPAITEYEVTAINDDGTTDIIFHPVTGRTHQLRVHSAHTLGLGCPIVGDMLYGGDSSRRLHLHAYEIKFRHPSDGKSVCFIGNSKKF